MKNYYNLITLPSVCVPLMPIIMGDFAIQMLPNREWVISKLFACPLKAGWWKCCWKMIMHAPDIHELHLSKPVNIFVDIHISLLHWRKHSSLL